MSITSIARSLPEHALIHGLRGLLPDSESTVLVPQGHESPLAATDPYFLGCRFHALLRRMADRASLSDQDKLLLPWLTALRTALRELGVGKLDPSIRFRCAHGIPSGEPDIVVDGGPRPHGVVELKVVNTVPARPTHEHLLQVGGYAAHLASSSRLCHPWASLVYASFREGKLSFFFYNDTRKLVRKSRMLFERAA